MLKYAVIDHFEGYDDFTEIYETEAEAMKAATYEWNIKTRREKLNYKRKGGSYGVAVFEPDEDGFIDTFKGYDYIKDFITDNID